MGKPSEVAIIAGHCNPESFALGNALMTSSEKSQFVRFSVEDHPFFEGMKGIALIVKVRQVERLEKQKFKITGTTRDQDGVEHRIEVEYSFALSTGLATIF